jgi:YggT family protein
MRLAAGIAYLAAQGYLLVLLARLVLDLVLAFARGWRPKGPVLVLAEVVFTLTDPPLRLVRKVIPPLRLGAVSLDVGFAVVFIAVSMIASALFTLSRSL